MKKVYGNKEVFIEIGYYANNNSIILRLILFWKNVMSKD